ncbi:MAG: GNAT family N-acetyltransferase [Treponema sp.]|nr:GNAT family N-acetyltransferase [Treponema sp.]
MEIKEYCEKYFNGIYEVIHKTIEEIYPKYYPKEAVDFFHNHHSKENMKKQLPNEYTLVIFENNIIIGTGSLSANEIKRFFILPEYQGNGYGKILLKELEKNINWEKYDTFILDSSLGAVKFYEKNGYGYKQYMTIDLPNGNALCYLEMEKWIKRNIKNN